MFKHSKEEVMHEIGSMALVAAGMFAGNIAANGLDKVLKVDDTTTGIKKFAGGAACLVVGAIGALELKNEHLKLAAAGVGASGVVRTLRKALPKVAILQGLGDSEDYMGLTPISAISQIPNWRYQESEQSYRPNLPDLGMGMIMPPASSDGYYIDASTNEPALRGGDDYMQGAEDAVIL